ncbi:MBL fold metallo-hydrolase [Photobacterium sp. MCCC 1A19761]|uniref:MBL fold metallo-hydrolase n=1 Tax=Photobacterium sp. MCCC 1A19761 TaxID=3115000 RepID=UPI00307E98A6
MELTTLVDNSRLADRPDLAVERGLSLHVKTQGRQILFDAGSSQIFCDNATRLNIDLQTVDAAVISHRHHDHCNGITHFLDCNAEAPVYFRACDEAAYSFRAFGFKSNVGIAKDLLEKAGERVKFVSQMTEILPGVFVVTELSHQYEQPKGNQYLFTDAGQGRKPDTFEHELMMVVKEEDGLVVFTGCAHHGVLNMVETALSLFPDTRIKAVVGGFHLVGLPLLNGIGGTPQDIEAIGRTLLGYPIDKLYTGHCTGMKAFGILKEVLGERLEHLPTGRHVVI